MIVRLVKMTFHAEHAAEFESLFKAKKLLIAACEGCLLVELLAPTQLDKSGHAIYFTRSKWDGTEYLEKYRSSDLFLDTWSQTKKLFADKAEAWTLEIHS